MFIVADLVSLRVKNYTLCSIALIRIKTTAETGIYVLVFMF